MDKNNKNILKKVKMFRIIFIILFIGVLFAIFEFSSQDATSSRALSRKVTEILVSNDASIQAKSPQEKEKIIKTLNAKVRKAAHFCIYTALGMLLMIIFITVKMDGKKRVIISLLIGVIYASSDEIHQIFVPGRGPQITDVIIDSSGVLVGIIIVLLFSKVYKSIKDRKQNRQNIPKCNN